MNIVNKKKKINTNQLFVGLLVEHNYYPALPNNPNLNTVLE